MLAQPTHGVGGFTARVCKTAIDKCLLSILAACLVIASPIASSQTNDWPAVEAAARKEGKVMLYHNLNPAGAERLANEFRKAYPAIKMEMTRLGSART